MNAVMNPVEELRRRLAEATPQMVRKALEAEFDVREHLPPYISNEVETEAEKSEFSYARLVKAMTYGNWSIAKKDIAYIRKSLGTHAFSEGAVFIPLEQDKDVIEMLKAESIARKLGVPVRPMKRSSLLIPRVESATGSSWGYAQETRTESTNMTFGAVQLIAKHLWALIYVDKDLIADADENVEIAIKEDGAKELALKLDYGFFCGSGVAPEPLGVINDPSVNNPDTSVASGSLADTHFDRCVTAVENDNGGPVTGWAMTPQLWHQVRIMKDAEGRRIAGDGDITKGIPRTLLGIPVELSTQLKNAAGTTHYAICGNFKKQAVIGERKAVQIEVNRWERWLNGEVCIMLDGRFDCRLKQPAAFAILAVTGVTAL